MEQSSAGGSGKTEAVYALYSKWVGRRKIQTYMLIFLRSTHHSKAALLHPPCSPLQPPAAPPAGPLQTPAAPPQPPPPLPQSPPQSPTSASAPGALAKQPRKILRMYANGSSSMNLQMGHSQTCARSDYSVRSHSSPEDRPILCSHVCHNSVRTRLTTRLPRLTFMLGVISKAGWMTEQCITTPLASWGTGIHVGGISKAGSGRRLDDPSDIDMAPPSKSPRISQDLCCKM